MWEKIPPHPKNISKNISKNVPLKLLEAQSAAG